MLIEVMGSKIHRIRVTETNLEYIGSIAIDSSLLEAANLLVNQKVQVVNLNNGERLDTYIISAPKGSGSVSLNGAAARKAEVGDTILVIAYVLLDKEEAESFRPTVIFPNADNALAPSS